MFTTHPSAILRTLAAHLLPATIMPQAHKPCRHIAKAMATTVFLCLGGVTTALAQVNIVQPGDGIEEYSRENALPYDSLQNITTQSVSCLPGQTVFIQGVKNDGSGYFQMFFTDNFLRSQAAVYHDNRYQFTPASDVVGRYYTVEKVWLRREQLGSACCLLLRDKATGHELYCNPWARSGAITSMGYYEKIGRASC